MKNMYVGIKGHVVCMDKYTGEELWRTKLARDWGKVTNVAFAELVFATLNGVTYCLSPKTGEIIWKNELEGLGTGTCIISFESSSQVVGDNQQQSSVASEIIDAAIDIVS